MSAAFDMIDHEILLDGLKEWFGLDAVALERMVSLNIVSSQFKSCPSGPIPSNSFFEPPRVGPTQ